MRIARAGGSRSPKQHRPVACGPLPSYTLPGLLGAGQGRRQQPAGPAHRALRPRHAPSSIYDPMGVPLPRSPAGCSGASPVGASPAAFPPSRSPPPRTARPKLDCPRCGPTQRPLVRAAAPADPASVSGADWKPICRQNAGISPCYLKVGTHLANCLQPRRKTLQARFFREGRCSAHIGANVRTCPGESLKRAPAAAALTKRGGRRRDPRAGPRGGTPRRDPTVGPDDGTRRRDPTPAAPKNEPQKQLVVQEIFPCA